MEILNIRKKIIRKKVVVETPPKINPPKINPIALIKKLPMDMSIYINAFLLDKRGINTDVVDVFHDRVLHTDEFIKKINGVYFEEVRKQIDDNYEYMNEFEYAIRKELAGKEYSFASEISFDEYETDDGRPYDVIGISATDGDDFYVEVVDENELTEKLSEIQDDGIYELHKYRKLNLGWGNYWLMIMT